MGMELPPGLGGAALRSWLLKKRQRDELLEGQAAADESDSEQPATSDHGAAVAAGPKDWPHSHIPPPPRRLGGAALVSYIKRQEQLLEEEGSELSGSSSGTALGAGGEELDAMSGWLGAVVQWRHVAHAISAVA